MGSVSVFVEQNAEFVERVFKSIEGCSEELIGRIREIAEIPSPTFCEGKRSAYVAKAFADAGLKDVYALPRGSVLGFTQSSHDNNTLLLAAHIDNVFPTKTELTTRVEGSILHGPGTGDNAANVGAIITLARIFKEVNVTTGRNLGFCCTVREEGKGNLGGMAEVLDAMGRGLTTVIAVDGSMPKIINRALAIQRYAVTVKGSGGHSWYDFGEPSAVHEMSKLVAALASVEVPDQPRTTFNVGTIQGGTAVNAIAQECRAEVDLRSLETGDLEALEREFLRIVAEVPSPKVETVAERIGTRPAGVQPAESALVKTIIGCARYLGFEPDLIAASTDGALSLARGIPAVAFGTYRGRGGHTLEERIELDSLATGLKWLALTVLMLAAA